MRNIFFALVIASLFFLGSSGINVSQASAATHSTIHVTSSVNSNGTYTISFIEDGVPLIDPLNEYYFVSASCPSLSCGMSGFSIDSGALTHNSLTTTALPNNGAFSYLCFYNNNNPGEGGGDTWCSQELPQYWWLNYSEPTPTPTPGAPIKIISSPSSSTQTVGTPFTVDVAVTDAGQAFNAAQATVAVSSNLSITGINTSPSNACNFFYTQTPTTSDPSFAGAIFHTSSTGCTVYTLTLTPTAAGAGTLTFTNASVKAYADSSEILTGVENGSFMLSNLPPTINPPVSPTYSSSITLAGTKTALLTHIFVNGSESNSTYPTSTTWQASSVALALGLNTINVYGADAGGNHSATVQTTVNRHTLGDINGDGNVDLTDASLFAVDWGKTDPNTFTYSLSDMNGDGVINLTDLSILARFE